MSTTTREEFIEELTKTIASIDNDAILAILWPQIAKTLSELPEGIDTLRELHKIGGLRVVKFISENQELWNQYCDLQTLLQGLQKCN